MSDPPDARPVRRLLTGLLKTALTIIIVYFLFLQVARHWEQIRDYPWDIRWGWLALSVATGLVTFLIMSANWQRLIAGFGHHIPLRKCWRIFYLADLGRYIPGKVWALLGVLYLARKEGVEPEQATASFVMVQLFSIPVSFLIFAIAFQVDPRILIEQVALLGDYSAWLFTLAMLAITAALVLWPRQMLAVANWGLARIGRPSITFGLDKSVALQLLLRYFLGWFCYGIAFYFFVRAVAGPTDLNLIAAAGIYNAAYQVGYLSFFAPGGFGPRELVMGLMLTPFLGPIGPAVAVVARLWAIVLETTAALLALGVRR